ncbi:hypothetical protein ABBQ32_012415 [Trebouxia sp. C0010 RCD-2024]
MQAWEHSEEAVVTKLYRDASVDGSSAVCGEHVLLVTHPWTHKLSCKTSIPTVHVSLGGQAQPGVQAGFWQHSQSVHRFAFGDKS